ncbi:uncharacterized protein LOC128541295 [Clarias gariepinus]|uniref:uncharacterized protein LOC128541295 n=1 Tax=Clarias gariepinus TaxID=13013 RepID=UPI00234D15CD|nr:uncharacterized protein LOC128541295 [Clarias gariepinus]
MKEHFFKFMQTMFDSDQAELAPIMEPQHECWYLPIFGVYHQKKDQIRVVFDSSAKYEGTSLNDVLLSGPDLNNTLLGVLIRFRKEHVAITADIQHMFYCFIVREDHRDFLRFLWFKHNDPNEKIVDYRMKVHVFGNSPSPAVAIYGLRRAVLLGEDKHDAEVKQFVIRNFYVDDGLASFPTSEEAITVLKRTKEVLAESNIRLHKIASNNRKVMEAFCQDDLAKDLHGIELPSDPLPLQRSLGLVWNLQTDTFTYYVSKREKPFTRRGILSVVNSLYDPLGFLAPVTVQGKALVRELTNDQCDWDTPIPAERKDQWRAWLDSLLELKQIQIKRPYFPISLCSTRYRELCIFADASTMAISAVAYLRAIDTEGYSHVGFLLGKSKLAPRAPLTVPRLELCSAVLAVEMADLLTTELDIELQRVKFYIDSRIVLGYIHNTSRRFHVYVANRVARIRRCTHPNQWQFVRTDQNPADHGTRFISPELLNQTSWFTGPEFLHKDGSNNDTIHTEIYNLVEPDTDVEVRSQVSALVTKASEKEFDSQRFTRFSNWKVLIRAIASLVRKVRSYAGNPNSRTDELTQARMIVVRTVQQETFSEELKRLAGNEEVSKHSIIRKLNPILDEDGVIRVGGRLSAADTCWEEKHPIIIPKNNHIATLLVRHFHEQVAHQGRHFTEGALRSAGLWIIGGKRLVSSVIHHCVICKRLRGKLGEQKMASLPSDRVNPNPPFTNVGVDVFGPWNIYTRRTRGGLAESKRWAVIFTCLGTRAVHFEVIESLSSASFINALRRFIAVRGPVKLFRSDRGTNFIGACKELKLNAEDPDFKSYLQDQGCTWVFNSPHSSHMGGVWERLISVARRILNALLLKTDSTRLSHEVLVTLMSEIMAIMNARPLVPISSDPDMPHVLSPATLLTQKIEAVSAPKGEYDIKDLYNKQWRQVQSLADAFWKRWRQEYLTTLQQRRKWQVNKPNLQVGDVVLLKDAALKRNEWPTGVIARVIPVIIRHCGDSQK